MILVLIIGQVGLHVQSHVMQDIHTELDIVTILPIVLDIEMSQGFAIHNLAKVSHELLHCQRSLREETLTKARISP